MQGQAAGRDARPSCRAGMLGHTAGLRCRAGKQGQAAGSGCRAGMQGQTTYFCTDNREKSNFFNLGIIRPSKFSRQISYRYVTFRISIAILMVHCLILLKNKNVKNIRKNENIYGVFNKKS